METTAGLLERTARRMVADLEPVEAVVLFGSRARGTAHGESDWDVAVLLDREPDLSIRAAGPVLEHVNVLYKNRNDFRERALHIGSLESAIVRDGQVLAGEWERPSQRGARIVDYELIKKHLITAASGVMGAVQHAGFVVTGGNDALSNVSFHAQSAAEFTSKAALMHLGIDPKYVHDLVQLANQMEREMPHDPRTAEWAAKVRSMNGLSADRHLDAYAGKPLETLDRPLEVVSTVTKFFAAVLRDITETREIFAHDAVEIAGAVEKRAQILRSGPDWGELPETTRVRLDAWTDEIQRIAQLAQSRAQQTTRGMRDPDESQGMNL